MKYISGIFALNINCDLDTCGDWHQSALKWDSFTLLESENSIWGDYGIEKNKTIPGHSVKYNVANHIRALLDLIQQHNFGLAGGMREDFICNDKYNKEIFEKVYMLRNSNRWNDISRFMGKEYCLRWIDFLEEHNERMDV
ncbi:MAG: hypothetical protein PUI48_09540 [Oscillospiraceae bacterium]|nr:hypothetical protein [Oscillospiraceae bacterium]MDY6207465.1 hypothetical protein [Oscillospiraceae bacterium]